MKRLPFNCRRCGQPCRDKGGLCIACDDRLNAIDSGIARNFPVHHTPATLFAQPSSDRVKAPEIQRAERSPA